MMKKKISAGVIGVVNQDTYEHSAQLESFVGFVG